MFGCGADRTHTISEPWKKGRQNYMCMDFIGGRNAVNDITCEGDYGKPSTRLKKSIDLEVSQKVKARQERNKIIVCKGLQWWPTARDSG
eukprot:1161991-Pelagomonas_calceolata.AAC.1